MQLSNLYTKWERKEREVNARLLGKMKTLTYHFEFTNKRLYLVILESEQLVMRTMASNKRKLKSQAHNELREF